MGGAGVAGAEIPPLIPGQIRAGNRAIWRPLATLLSPPPSPNRARRRVPVDDYFGEYLHGLSVMAAQQGVEGAAPGGGCPALPAPAQHLGACYRINWQRCFAGALAHAGSCLVCRELQASDAAHASSCPSLGSC